MSRDQQRHAEQLAFVASGCELEVGQAEALPLPREALIKVCGDEPWVVARMSGGLTAEVWRIRVDGQDYTLKRARERCLVQNVDGQTSFLNEIQRRADIEALKAAPGGRAALSGVVDTVYGSFRSGILLSPWIEGELVSGWDERRLADLFGTLGELVLNGLFEWDLCPGNLLDDGRVRLFDFGYMYRFDPLTDYNSAGRDAPQFHFVERFETRNFFAALLELERTECGAAALGLFALEKQLAVEAYERLIARLAARQADAAVLHWLGGIVAGWRSALTADIGALYLAEGWRSHRADLDDDLHGQTCTTRTLARADWLITALGEHYADLLRLGAIAPADAAQGRAAILDRLQQDRSRAEAWQVAPHSH